MKLFPRVLARVAGGPFEELEQLNSVESWQIICEMLALKQKIDASKHELSERLHRLVSEKPSHREKRLLINLRREIFNEQSISPARLQQIAPLLPQNVRQQIETFHAIQLRKEELLKQGEEVFVREVKELREKFCQLARNETLLCGLLLSSQSLLKRAEDYFKTDKTELTKSERNSEKSLIKYLSRMYSKTSPFSTFTNLVMGEITENSKQNGAFYEFSLNGNRRPYVISHIRLNNFLYAYLKALLIKIPDIYRHFVLRPNPTLRESDGQYLYLTNSNNIDAFQRIPANPVLEVFRHLASENREGIAFKNLVATIIANEYIDATAEELTAYINQLLEYGFLEFNFGVSGIDPDWDLKLCQQLKPIAEESQLVGELMAVLKNVRQLADNYGMATLLERQQILQEAHQQFREICMQLHEAAGLPAEERKPYEEYLAEERKKHEEGQNEQRIEDKKEPSSEDESQEKKDEPFKHQSPTVFYFKPEQMFYEDSSLNATLKLDASKMSEVISTLHGLLQELKHFEGWQDERDKMLFYFREKFGEMESVDLLTFYESYYRDVKKPEAKREEEKRRAAAKKRDTDNAANENQIEAQAKTKPPEIPAIKIRQEQNQAWLDQFTEIIRNSNGAGQAEVRFTRRQILQTHEKLQRASTNHSACSYGVFVQLFLESRDGEKRLMGVLNGSTPGFGKMFSRFLHVFDTHVTDELRSWNASNNHPALLVEDCDASYFNANLHPPLLPYEIWMPNGHNSLPPEKQIAVTELKVRLDKTKQVLDLVHTATQKPAHIFDLGFQGYAGRSQLFQLLTKFAGVEYLSVWPLLDTINRKGVGNNQAQQDTILIHPRVVYEGRLILQRRAWLVPKALLPSRRSGESQWEFFVRVNYWRQEHKIPVEVFVTVNPRRRAEKFNIDPEAFKNVARDDYKPQYICFKNPLLVILFEKLLAKVPHHLKIEEMLPNSQQLLLFDQKRYVSEFVIQWYTDGSGSSQ
jgi:hypothetical protein